MAARVHFEGAGATATTPAGADTQVQFNDAGSFGASAGLTFNKTNGELVINQLANGKGLSIYGNGANAGSYFKASVDNFGQPIISTNGTARFANTGSFLLTAGGYARFTSSGFSVISSYSTFGTTTNLGARVNIKGTGATAATTSLLVQNSAGTELSRLFDNGFTTLGGASAYNNYLLDLKGANTTLRLQSGQNFSNAYCGIGFTNSSNGSSLSSEIRAYRQASINELRFVFGATHALAVHSTGQIGIGTVTPDASAILDITSTTQGLLPPRMTSVQLAAIAAPAAGLQVYDTTTNNLNYFNGTVWVAL